MTHEPLITHLFVTTAHKLAMQYRPRHPIRLILISPF
jgi:hypothetical protein